MVTNPRIFSLSMPIVSLGVRSSATIMDGTMDAGSVSFFPVKLRIRRLEISFTSSALALIYSSSILANSPENVSPAAPTAYSALTLSVRIMRRMVSRYSLSSSSI